VLYPIFNNKIVDILYFGKRCYRKSMQFMNYFLCNVNIILAMMQNVSVHQNIYKVFQFVVKLNIHII